MGTVLWFAPGARKIGRKGKIKNVVPMGFSADGEFFGYSGNTAHSSSIGFLNYPMLRPNGPRAAQYQGYVAWRNHMGISVRNSGRPLKARCHGDFFSTLNNKVSKDAQALLGGKTCP